MFLCIAVVALVAAAPSVLAANTTECNTFCTLVNQVCADPTTGITPYGSNATTAACMQSCSLFPNGQNQSDTYECRLGQAMLVPTDQQNAPALCTAAGPTGGNVCGTYKHAYCRNLYMGCASVMSTTMEVTDTATCLANVATWAVADGSAMDWQLSQTLNASLVPRTNTYACRWGFLGIATLPLAMGGSSVDLESCRRATPTSTDGYCQPAKNSLCPTFCSMLSSAPCNATGNPYGPNCASACAVLPNGVSNDDSFQCRYVQAGLIGNKPLTNGSDIAVACGAASAPGGGVCGTWAQAYCRNFVQGCGAITNVTDIATCIANITAKNPMAGTPTEWGAANMGTPMPGNTYACRWGYLGLATANIVASGPDATQCARASPASAINFCSSDTRAPTASPTSAPTAGSTNSTASPTNSPTSSAPTRAPTGAPTGAPAGTTAASGTATPRVSGASSIAISCVALLLSVLALLL